MRLAVSVYLSVLSVVAVTGFSPFGRLTKSQSLPSIENRIVAVAADHAVIALDRSSATPFELWCVDHLEEWYSRSITIKCPFFRRRAADTLDALDQIIRFVVIRHKSLDILPPLGCRPIKRFATKNENLEISKIADIIQTDWKVKHDKGYYITGRLNTTIYRDDCLFDGPDPDMPVTGLRTYVNAASQLFDHAKSSAQLLSLRILDDKTLVARWRMEGVLRLPWRPALPQMIGKTTYHLDEKGLIYLHEETWDISVAEAFARVFVPNIARRIWDTPLLPDDTN